MLLNAIAELLLLTEDFALLFLDDLIEATDFTDVTDLADDSVVPSGVELLPPPQALNTAVSDKTDIIRSECVLKFSISLPCCVLLRSEG